jgi:hypothetical protein
MWKLLVAISSFAVGGLMVALTFMGKLPSVLDLMG